MRKHWIDNLRWVTVLLVLLYHVFYFYNNKGVIGGIGGFGDGPQYQDLTLFTDLHNSEDVLFVFLLHNFVGFVGNFPRN